MNKPTVAASRRSFLEKLGLGIGAVLLSPIAETLVAEARGETVARKIAVFYIVGNGINYDYNFTPAEFRAPDLRSPVMNGPKEYSWPKMVAPLERYRSRMLLIDGLANVPHTGTFGHSTGYSTLSCFAAVNGRANEGGPPGGVTIDQWLASRISPNTRRRSVLYGVSQKPEPLVSVLFASGRERPEPHFQSPTLLFNDLFGTLVSDASGVNTGLTRQRVLMDTLRADIKRLQNAFAPTERRKLDVYLAALEDFEKREKASAGITCKVPGAPALGAKPTVEDQLDSMHEMGILALTCGLTNVLGISLGGGSAHDYFPTFKRLAAGTRWEAGGGIPGHAIGHEGRDVQGPAMDLIHGLASAQIARLADALSAVSVGDSTLFDNTVALYTSDCTEMHHCSAEHCPSVLIGTAGGKLRTDGRFIRYPKRGTAGSRSMADLFCSIATACGAPTDDFGKGGNEPVKGPLPELMV